MSLDRSVEMVRYLCRHGKLPHRRTEDGRYRIDANFVDTQLAPRYRLLAERIDELSARRLEA